MAETVLGEKIKLKGSIRGSLEAIICVCWYVKGFLSGYFYMYYLDGPSDYIVITDEEQSIMKCISIM